MRLAVVGATGAVGRTILVLLEERGFAFDTLTLLASERSAGQRVSVGGGEYVVEALADGWHRDVDLALVSAGAAVSKWALPPAAANGTVCIDNSSAWRMTEGVPLVIPEINADALGDVGRDGRGGIVANPNCTAITALMPLGPLHRAFGLTSIITSSYQSTSGAGQKGLRELVEQVEKLHGQEDLLRRAGREPDALPTGEVFGRTIAYNVIPRVERFDPDGSGFTSEELKMGNEARKVLGIPGLPVVATAVRVPTAVGHGVSIHARFARPVTVAEACEALDAAPGVRLMDDPSADLFPTPLDAAGLDDVLVGRVRRDPNDDHALVLFAAGDNLRKGAALNAVQIAEHLAGR
jgi:aspartate-semialdehyde dehydrogenase